MRGVDLHDGVQSARGQPKQAATDAETLQRHGRQCAVAGDQRYAEHR